MYITHTAYTSSLLNCYSEMIEKYSNGESQETTVTDREFDSNYEMVVPTFPSKTMYSLIEKYRKTASISYANDNTNSDGYIVNINNFTKDVFENSVIELGSMSFDNAIKFCNTVIKDDINSFYGVLMFDKNNRILNPFHPLIASSMASKIKNDKNFLREKYRTVLYGCSLNNKNQLFQYGNDGIKENIQNNIAHQLIIYDENHKFCTINRIVNSPEDLLFQASLGAFKNVDIERTTGYFECEHDDTSIEFVGLVPVHIGVRGIAFPWYGSVLAWRGKIQGSTTPDTYGVHLSPFLSANVGYRDDELNSNSLVFNNMCTGNHDRSKLEGIRTINRANFDSPLCNFGVETGWIQWKDECVKTSLEIYAEVIDLTVKEKKLSYKEQWLKDNPSLSESDYLVHLSQKLTQKQPNIDTPPEPKIVVTSTPTNEESLLDTALAGLRTLAQNEVILRTTERTDALFNALFSNEFTNQPIQANTTEVELDDAVDAIARASAFIIETPTPRRTRRRRNPETGMLE